MAIEVLPARLRRPVERVASVLARGRAALVAAGQAEDVLWAIWEASGLARVWERQSRDGGAGGCRRRSRSGRRDRAVRRRRPVGRPAAAAPTALALHEHSPPSRCPVESCSRGRAPAEAVQILTAHASKGLEWDLVCVAGVQEGRWPDLRRRGSLLGSELLVDIVAEARRAGYSIAPQLAEERRLFYVAITRARAPADVTAVSGEDEQPSRFLDELDPIDGERPVHRPAGDCTCASWSPSCAPPSPTRTPAEAVRAHAAARAGPAGRGRGAGRRPGRLVGPGRVSDERGLVEPDAGPGQPVGDRAFDV